MTLDASRIFGRGISFPPRVGPDGRIVWSEGEENVREAIRIILLTDQGERLMLPDFGGDLSRFLFEPNTASTRQLIKDRIQRALEAWEPRIRLESVDVDPDPNAPGSAVATITFNLVATQISESVSLTIALNGS